MATLTQRMNANDIEIASIKGELKAIREMLSGSVDDKKLDQLLEKFDYLMNNIIGDMDKPV